MMILVANLRLSGFFAVAGGWIMRRAHRPLTAGEGGDNRGQAAVADTPRTQRAGLCRDRLVVAVMFAGLFIIVTGADSSLLGGGVIAAAGRLQLDRLPVLSALTAILANLIVVQRAAAGGVVIGVWDYCRVGVPLTLLIGTLWLSM